MEEKKSGIKKFLEEFKAFAMRGNVLDMAVGVVIGGAFTAIVNSLVNDIINPAIGLFFNADFSDVGIHVGDVMIGIGSFINAIINFLIVAFVLFVVIKTINALHKKPAEPEAPAEPHHQGVSLLPERDLHQGGALPPLHQQAGGLPGDQQLSFRYKKSAVFSTADFLRRVQLPHLGQLCQLVIDFGVIKGTAEFLRANTLGIDVDRSARVGIGGVVHARAKLW